MDEHYFRGLVPLNDFIMLRRQHFRKANKTKQNEKGEKNRTQVWMIDAPENDFQQAHFHACILLLKEVYKRKHDRNVV